MDDAMKKQPDGVTTMQESEEEEVDCYCLDLPEKQALYRKHNEQIKYDD